METVSPLTVRVADLLSRPLVVCRPDVSVREAACLMVRADSGSVVVVDDDGHPQGMITDSDLRRVVAGDVDPRGQLTHVMSQPVIVISRDTLGFQAVATMLQRGIHHLVVHDGTGRAYGVLTEGDFVASDAEQPLLLTGRIRRARGIRELAAARAVLPRTARLLLSSGASAVVVGQILAEAHDHIVRTLLTFAQVALGPAPAPFCWLVLGSDGRREPTLHTDQDNGLIYADDAPPGAAGYFERLAEWMVDALERTGARRCPGDAMATNPLWCAPLAGWQRQFRDWLEHPEPLAILDALIAFDFRPVAGDGDLADRFRAWLAARTPSAAPFLARVAGRALDRRPPLGFMGRFLVERSGARPGTFDLKTRGVALIVDGARLLVLSHGLAATNTVERLTAAGQRHMLASEDVLELLAAFEALQGLRLRQQAARITAGELADNRLDPKTLARSDAAALRVHFQSVRRLQEALEVHFPPQLRGA
jgi:CBS domain-containing protein